MSQVISPKVAPHKLILFLFTAAGLSAQHSMKNLSRHHVYNCTALQHIATQALIVSYKKYHFRQKKKCQFLNPFVRILFLSSIFLFLVQERKKERRGVVSSVSSLIESQCLFSGSTTFDQTEFEPNESESIFPEGKFVIIRLSKE